MSDSFDSGRETMLEIFFFETNQLLEILEELLLISEKSNEMSSQNIDEIFRIMHTIKGSSTMMKFNNIASLSHAIEDLFDFIRESHKSNLNYSDVYDVVLLGSDFIKEEMAKIENGKKADGNETLLLNRISKLLSEMKGNAPKNEVSVSTAATECLNDKNYITGCGPKDKDNLQKYCAKVFFESGCMMENIRAFTLVFNIKDICCDLYYRPQEIADDNTTAKYIIENGFDLYFSTDLKIEKLKELFSNTLFVDSFELILVDSFEDEISDLKDTNVEETTSSDENKPKKVDSDNAKNVKQSLVSVNIKKMDTLMDLIGELIITEAMVTKSPDLKDLPLDNFKKSSRQLRKLLNELQENVMSIRMIPVETVFNKMHRIVRDMGKQLGKDAELVIVGEETEVDKNVIDHLSDPLMHLIRNSMDHGIESAEERVKAGKPPKGKITLKANNTGGDVIITMYDDGRGLDRKKILKKAKENGLINKQDKDLTDNEVFSYILHPGFSTKESVTEFSGRGVGMDVVKRNIEKVGGSVSVKSQLGKGMMVSINIPLTLTIIDGMKLSVGKSIYTIPTTLIREFFKAEEGSLVKDADNNEMIMVRGECYPILRLHKQYNVETDITNICDGVMVLIESDGKALCLLADSLIGDQQLVVKPLPNYLLKFNIRQRGISGCTILGDGNISLILDVKAIINGFM